jgi:hypothetical protein
MGHWLGAYTLGLIESSDRVFEYHSWHSFISENSCAGIYIRNTEDWLVWI